MPIRGASRTHEPVRLLDSILSDKDLARRVQDMSGDSKTVTLSLPDGADFTHPSFAKNDPQETVILDSPPTVAISAEKSLVDRVVPRRNVASLSGGVIGEPDYRLVGELGSGGTGVVFQAHQRAVDREVAVKMLRSELATNSVSRERFLTEARVIGGLDHPNVIALHEVYVDEPGNLYYSMKRIDGTSWDKQIADMTQQQNLETLLRVADAIRYAHSRGLIHRDIKPENVMLGRFGEVLLADWGLAINRGSVSGDDDIHQSIGGTPAYMAPELANGFHSDIVLQSDVYLLGATLFQILTGHPPHFGKSLLECIRAAADNVIRPTEIESELLDVAMKAMETRPQNRYQSVDAFIDAIQAHRQHEQSNRLLRRASRRIKESDESDPYRDFSIADALLSEAIDVWPENRNAISSKKQFQMQLADIAAQRGDLDLAATIYESIGEAKSKKAKALRRAIENRDTNHRKVSRYSALFTKSPDPGLLLQMESGKIVEANEAFEKLFGYDRPDVVGREIEQLNLWVCPQRREQLVQHLKDHGEIDEFDATMQNREGRHIDVLISARVANIQGEDMLVSTIRDISLRKKAESDLKKSRQKLRDLQRLAGLATWSYDVASDTVSWSRETFQLAGRNHEEGSPSSREYFQMVHPDDQPRLQRAMKTAIKSGAAYELSILQKVAGGEYQDVIVRAQPIFDEDGKTIEVYGVVLPK